MFESWHGSSDNLNTFQQWQGDMLYAFSKAKVVSADELKNAPKGFKSKDSIGVAGAKYTIQVSAKDCTGCASCANVCPLKDSENKPLTMTPIAKVVEQQDNN